MQFGNLPVDGIRPILFYVDLDDLTKLFCTFDRRLMKVLSFPGTIPHLRMEPSAIRLPRAPLRYFMSHVRNVKHLSLVRAKWSPQSLSLLLTLNPTHLEFDEQLMHESALRLLEDLAQDSSNPELRSQASFLQPNGLPDFSRLTTRLETLTFQNTLDSHSPTYTNTSSLPPTVTVLRGNLCYDVSSLPTGLRSVSLGNESLRIDELFSRLTRLQELELVGNDTLHCGDSLVFPSTLTTVKFHGQWLPMKILPIQPRQVSGKAVNGGRGSVTNMEISHASDLFLARLPPSVTRIDLKSSPRTSWRDCGLSAWPIGLRTLNLDLQSSTSLSGISSLQHLEKASFSVPWVVQSDCDVPTTNSLDLYLASFPESVKSLNIDCSRFSPLSKVAMITPRLSLLTSLVAHHIQLDELSLLRSHAPLCRVYFETMHNISGPEIAEKFERYGIPPSELLNATSMMLDAFSVANNDIFEMEMRCSCVQKVENETEFSFARKVIITSEYRWIDINSMTERDGSLHLCSQVHSITLRGLAPRRTGMSPHSLKVMDLGTCTGSIQLSSLPASLTSLSSPNATVTAYTKASANWPFRQLRHLDTPNWSIMAHSLGDLRGLEVFNANIVNLADYNVIHLLTSAVTPQTRRNMKIGIAYYITGAVAPDDDVDGLKDVTWSSIKASTTVILNRLLAAPMPRGPTNSTSIDGNDLEIHDDLIKNDTVGRVVTNIAEVIRYRNGVPICIPSSATRANLDTGRELTLLPDWKHTNPLPNGLKPQLEPERLVREPGPVLFEKHNFPRLVSLTLKNVAPREMDWANQLPASLRFLYVSHYGHSDAYDSLPPNLEVLILESSCVGYFPFGALPASIRRLALLVPGWSTEDNLPNDMELPNLTTVLFRSAPRETLESIWPVLVKAPLERAEICESNDALKDFVALGLKVVKSIDWPDLLRESDASLELKPRDLSTTPKTPLLAPFFSNVSEPPIQPFQPAQPAQPVLAEVGAPKTEAVRRRAVRKPRH